MDDIYKIFETVNFLLQQNIYIYIYIYIYTHTYIYIIESKYLKFIATQFFVAQTYYLKFYCNTLHQLLQ